MQEGIQLHSIEELLEYSDRRLGERCAEIIYGMGRGNGSRTEFTEGTVRAGLFAAFREVLPAGWQVQAEIYYPKRNVKKRERADILIVSPEGRAVAVEVKTGVNATGIRKDILKVAKHVRDSSSAVKHGVVIYSDEQPDGGETLAMFRRLASKKKNVHVLAVQVRARKKIDLNDLLRMAKERVRQMKTGQETLRFL